MVERRVKVHDATAADAPIGSVVGRTIVDDPWNAGGRLRVLRNVRDDPLAWMHSRKRISDQQFAAGRRWQEYREDAEIGGARAIDPTIEPVDGGRWKEPNISALSYALAELRTIDFLLQAYEASLVYDVLARNMSITEIALARSITSGRQIGSLMDRFRGALDTMAVHWGFMVEAEVCDGDRA